MFEATGKREGTMEMGSGTSESGNSGVEEKAVGANTNAHLFFHSE